MQKGAGDRQLREQARPARLGLTPNRISRRMRGELPALPNINRIAGTIRGMIRNLTLTLVAFAGLAAAMPASAQADFRSCLSGLRSQAAAKGISGAGFRRGHTRDRGRSQDPRTHGQPAGVQDRDLGLSVGAGRRPAGPGRHCRHAAMGPGAQPGGSPFRRRSLRDRGGLGRRVGFRQEFRRSASGAVARHALLLRAPASGLFRRRADGDPEDRAGRRHRSGAC